MPDKASILSSGDPTPSDLDKSEATQGSYSNHEYVFEESDDDVSVYSDTSIQLTRRDKRQDLHNNIMEAYPKVGFDGRLDLNRPYGSRTKVSGFLIQPRSDTHFHLGAWRDPDTKASEASCCINQALSLEDLQPLSDESIEKYKCAMTTIKTKPLESGPDPSVVDLKSYLKFRILGIGRCKPEILSLY